MGFTIINHLSQLDRSINAIAQQFQIPQPGVLSMMKMKAGIQEGLDEDGSAAFVLLPIPEGAEGEAKHPGMAIFVPVSDYKKFISQFNPDDADAQVATVTVAGDKSLVGHKGSFAVFGPPETKDQLVKILTGTAGVEPIVAPLADWIGKHDASFIATPAGIKLGIPAARAGLKEMSAKLGQAGPQAAQAVSAMEMYDGLLKLVGEEVQQLGIGIRVDEGSNLFIDKHVVFVPGGKLAAAMHDIKPPEGARLAGLPGGDFAIAYEGVNPNSWGDAMVDFAVRAIERASEAAGQKLSDEQSKKYAEAVRLAKKGLRSTSFLMTAPKPGESIFGGMTTVMKVDDARAFLPNYQQSLEQMNEVTKGLNIPTPKFGDVKKSEIDGAPSLEFTMDFSAMMGAQAGGAGPIMPILFGPGGKLTAYLGIVDDHTVVTAYGSEENLKHAIAAIKNPQPNLAADAQVAATLRLLSQNAQWVGFLSPKGMVSFVGAIAAQFGPVGAMFQAVTFPESPPIGFAMEVTATGLDAQLVIPKETLTGMGVFGKQLQGMLMPQQGGGKHGPQ